MRLCAIVYFKILDFYQNESIVNSDDVWLSYILKLN